MEETQRDLRRAYGESLRHLDDLRSLGGANIAPIAGQIQYHLASMLEVAQSAEPLARELPQLFKIFQNQLINNLYNQFKPGDGVKTISHFLNQKAGLRVWEKFLTHDQSLYSLAKSFNPSAISLSLEADGFVLGLETNEAEDISEARKLAYRFTQDLWQENALLTYRVSERNSRPWLEIAIRFAGLSAKDLSLTVGDLAFDPLFVNYMVSREELVSIGDHHIVSISESAVVTLHREIPEQLTCEQTFIHLPFLFRPLSLIISGRGMLQAKHAKYSRVELFDLFR
ncbi:MAG: hypothetical protein CME71_04540 [Halobacteriovorax sp.]|nr:hypothetical protein [Halobacteriovorax sp.]